MPQPLYLQMFIMNTAIANNVNALVLVNNITVLIHGFSFIITLYGILAKNIQGICKLKLN